MPRAQKSASRMSFSASDPSAAHNAALDRAAKFGDDDDDLDFLGTAINAAMRRSASRRRRGPPSILHNLLSELALSPGGKNDSCQYCEEYEQQWAEETKGFYSKAEKLRNGLEKLLEQCANLVSGQQLDTLVDALHLEVHYLTDAPKDPKPRVVGSRRASATGQRENPMLAKLRQKVRMLEEELEGIERDNERLKRTLDEGPAAVGGAGGRGRLSSMLGPSLIEAMQQTDRVRFAGEAELDSDDEPGAAGGGGGGRSRSGGAKGGTAKRSGGRSGGGKPGSADGADDDDSEDGSDGGGGPGRRRRARRGAPDAAAVSDPAVAAEQEERIAQLLRDMQRAQSERDLVAMKVKSAERTRAKAEEEARALERKIRERDGELQDIERQRSDAQRLVDALEKQVKELEAKKAAEEASGKAGKKKGKKKAAGGAAPGGKAQGAAAAGGPAGGEAGGEVGDAGGSAGEVSPGAVKRRLITDDDVEGGGPSESAGATSAAGAAAAAAESEESDEEDEPPAAEMVDKCVGNGPGPGLQDWVTEHKRLTSAPAPPRELNPTGKVYSRDLRAVPGLALCTPGAAANLAVTAPPAHSDGGKAFSAPSQSLPPVALARSAPSLHGGGAERSCAGRKKRATAATATSPRQLGMHRAVSAADLGSTLAIGARMRSA